MALFVRVMLGYVKASMVYRYGWYGVSIDGIY